MREAPQITVEQAAALVPDGASLMAGGFGMTGNPVHLLHAPAETSASEQRMRIAERALQELKPGDVVNLGVGIPTLIANLITPALDVTLHSESGMLGVGPSPEEGGAMDLAQGAKRLIITMTHRHKDGPPKIVPECNLPLTALGAVNTVITDLAVFEFVDGELTLIEIMPGSSLEEVQTHTGARFKTALQQH